MEFLRCNHGCDWRPKDGSTCIACGLEYLESADKPLITKKHILQIVADLLLQETEDFLIPFSRDVLSIKRLCSVLIDAAHDQQDLLLVPSLDSCFSILIQQYGDGVENIIVANVTAKCYAVSDYNDFLPILSIMRSLLERSMRACEIVFMGDGNFSNFLLGLLEFPSRNLQALVLEIFTQLLKAIASIGPTREYQGVLCCALPHLSTKLLYLATTGDCTDILIQCLRCINYASTATDFLEWLAGDYSSNNREAYGESVTELLASLKRLILRRDERLTCEVVQCTMILLESRADSFREPLLNADLAEFIYDALRSTTSPDLVSSIYCCILLLAESDTFHQNCHASYGLESVLRSLQELLRSSHSILCAQGLSLIGTILQRQPEGVCILKTLSLFDRTIETVKDGIGNKHPSAAISATHTASTLIDRFPEVYSLKEVGSILNVADEKLVGLASLMAGRSTDTNVEAVDISVEEDPNERTSIVRRIFLSAWKLLHSVGELVRRVQLKGKGDSEGTRNCAQRDYSLLVCVLIRSAEKWLRLNTKTVEALASPTVIHAMLLALAATCRVSTDAGLTKTLNTGVVVRLALTAKARFFQESRYIDLLQACCNFLFELSSAGIRDSIGQPSNELQTLLKSGFYPIHGKASEYIKLLQDKAVSMRRESTLSVHCAVIALLFNSFWYGGRENLPVCDLIETLNEYIMMNETLNHLPMSTVKQMAFLYAMCQTDITSSPVFPGSLLSWLSDNSSFILHPAFLSCILRVTSEEPSVKHYQERLVAQWANSGKETESFQIKFLSYLCERSNNASEVVLHTLVSSNTGTEQGSTDNLVGVICTTFSYHHQRMMEQQETHDEAINAGYLKMKRDIPKLVYDRMCCFDDGELVASTLQKLISLMNLVTLSIDEDMETYSYILRVIKRVLAFISNGDFNDESVVSMSLRLVRTVLTRDLSENQVRSVLLAISSQSNFVKRLSSWCFAENKTSQEIEATTADVISLLVTLHHTHGIEAKQKLILDLNRLLSSSRGHLISAPLRIWTSLLETTLSENIVRLETSGGSPHTMKGEDYRKLWNSALLLTASKSLREKDIAFSCLLAVIKFASLEDNGMYSALLANPWLGVVITRSIEEIANTNDPCPSPWVKNFYELHAICEKGESTDESEDGAVSECDFEDLVLEITADD